VESAASRSLFASRGYVIVRAYLDAALADFLWSYARARAESGTLKSGDSQVPDTPAEWADPAFEALLEWTRPRAEAHTGLELFPTYSYFRLYKRGDELAKHTDRPACEISVSINLGQTPARSWALNIEGAAGVESVELMPGDALVYRGIECEHWRDRYLGERLGQTFLHYVDKNGPNVEWKFDKRQGLRFGYEEDITSLGFLRSLAKGHRRARDNRPD
jgi:hypothetical protein